jgi:DNA-binding MarR family transcriptional regulator
MAGKPERSSLIQTLDEAINAFNRDGRLSRQRAIRRGRRLTGLDWTYSALLIMEEMKESRTLRMTELADLIGATPPTITKLVKDLEGQGLVSRVPDEQDGRASILSLTEEGRRMAESIGGQRIADLHQVITEWSDDDLERFITLFERLRTDMRRMS